MGGSRMSGSRMSDSRMIFRFLFSLRHCGHHPIPDALPGRDRRNDVHNWGSWRVVRSDRYGSGTIKMVEDLCQPDWVVQKQPANHCLKPRSPAVGGSLSGTWTTSCTVATATDEIKFLSLEKFMLLQPGEESGLGIGSNVSDDSPMEDIRPPRSGPVTQSLMQLPDSVSDPGQLKWTKLLTALMNRLGSDPAGQAAS